VTDFKRSITGNKTDELSAYDFEYYLAKMDKKNGDEIDESEIAKYFPFEHIVQQTMEIYEELLGLKITQIECKAWEPEVTCFFVNDEDSDELIGEFYLDVFKREGKQDAAFASTIMPKSKIGPSKMKAISYMYTNFE
jgi:Zn-dependent oligopeptidase